MTLGKGKIMSVDIEVLESLVDKFNQYEIAEKLSSTPSTICKLIKIHNIYYKRKTPKCGCNNKGGNNKEEFEIKVRGNYAGATVYLYRTCKYFPKNNHHKRVLVMYRGKLENTEIARKWWNAKIERAWERRRYYSN